MRNSYIDVDLLTELKNNFIIIRYYIMKDTETREDVIKELIELKNYCKDISIRYVIEGAHITVSYMNIRRNKE